VEDYGMWTLYDRECKELYSPASSKGNGFFFLYNQSETSVFNAKRSLEANSFFISLEKENNRKKENTIYLFRLSV
jgi:hypothetical protein